VGSNAAIDLHAGTTARGWRVWVKFAAFDEKTLYYDKTAAGD
jgi:hypothetical protein